MSEFVDISQRIYTVEEYFDIEKTSEIRHEFENGILIPMPGETLDANEIAGNISATLRKELRQKGYRIFTHDIRTIVHERSRPLARLNQHLSAHPYLVADRFTVADINRSEERRVGKEC